MLLVLRENVTFRDSVRLPDIPATETEAAIQRQYSDYTLVLNVAGIETQDVRVLSHNKIVTPYEGAVASAEFWAKRC